MRFSYFKKEGTIALILLTLGAVLVLNTGFFFASQKIIEVSSADDVKEKIMSLKNTSLIFLDIDDTIITPTSKTLRTKPYRTMIDDIKKDRATYPNFEEIISRWRLQRKVMLLDNKWPDVIKTIKKQFKVYGLTKMDIGKCGSIKSIEKWRYQELKRFNMTFSDNDKILPFEKDGFSFYKGIFFTGKNTKSRTINHYFDHLQTDTIVLVDDRKENLDDVMRFCKEKSLNFIGMLYKPSDLDIQTNEKVALFQKEYLKTRNLA